MTSLPTPVTASESGPQLMKALAESVGRLRAHMCLLEVQSSPTLDGVLPRYVASARNLIHYLALRQHDIRLLQAQLAELGLSSLGRTEAHVLASVEAVLARLQQLGADVAGPPSPSGAPVSFEEGERLLTEHTAELLGPQPGGRDVRIMVTLPSEAATDYPMVHDLVTRGVDIMRINCAHDDPEAWAAMVHNVRQAQAELRRNCRIVMDLAGPKLRTGPMEPGDRIAVWRPRRDTQGRVTEPARVWLTAAGAPTPSPSGGAVAPLPDRWLPKLRLGDRISLVDLRGKKRRMAVVKPGIGGYWGELDQTAYVGPFTVLRAGRRLRSRLGDRDDTTPLGEVPARAQVLELNQGDTLVLTAAPIPGRPPVFGPHGEVEHPAHISCTLPEVFADVRVGDRVFFDDGKIGGAIVAANAGEVTVEVTQTGPKGAKLRADKGINLPDSALHISGLSEKDREDLAFIVDHVDIVELSFAEDMDTLTELMDYLAAHAGGRVGIVLKIETRRGFDRLPNLLLASMRQFPTGVMIARGDLAVECGWERMAEIQEEILWICEAAHVPAIWATQVLETMVKTGLPSRAEITDAASSERAECVMLNKGPHILAAVGALDDILRRMQEHQHKKSAMLRELKVSSGVLT